MKIKIAALDDPLPSLGDLLVRWMSKRLICKKEITFLCLSHKSSENIIAQRTLFSIVSEIISTLEINIKIITRLKQENH